MPVPAEQSNDTLEILDPKTKALEDYFLNNHVSDNIETVINQLALNRPDDCCGLMVRMVLVHISRLLIR
jgi:hypothetical protein